MNPLSSLSLLSSPQFQPDLLAQATQGLSTKAIPAGELSKLSAPPETAPVGISGPAGGSFSSFLGQMVQDVNAKQVAAGEAANGLMSGQNVTLHQAVIAMEEANVSFQLMVQVRNKLLDSYQELMRMQI
jgi:flagellar hook-basal body complex protein FliE